MSQRPRISTRHPGVFYRERPDGSRQYIIWFHGTDGKDHFQNVPGNEGDAKRARAKIINDMAHGVRVEPTRILFSEFAREWLDEQTNLAPRTLDAYESQIRVHLIPRLGPRVRLNEVDVNRVARLIAGMQKEGYRTNSIRCALKPLSRIMATAARRGLVMVNPVTQLDRTERPKGDAKRISVLDSHEIKGMLEHAQEKYKAPLATLVFTGMRIGELLSLRWEDIMWDTGIVVVHGTKTSGSDREVVLMPALQQKLAARSLEAKPGERVFAVSRNAVRDAMRAALRASGVSKHVRVHDLRHTFASLLISQGHDTVYIAKQMGHTNSSMIEKTYGHLIDKQRRYDQARERMEASFGELLGSEVLS